MSKKKESKNIVLIIVAFVIGFVAYPLVFGDFDFAEEEEHAHATDLPHGHHAEEHKTIELAAESAPTVEVVVHEDPKSGWNIQIITENFKFSPERASLDHVFGEGHAHLYIDGVKVTRLYNKWFHIPELTKGMHEIRVTLNSNSHEDYVVNGEVIGATAMITVA